LERHATACNSFAAIVAGYGLSRKPDTVSYHSRFFHATFKRIGRECFSGTFEQSRFVNDREGFPGTGHPGGMRHVECKEKRGVMDQEEFKRYLGKMQALCSRGEKCRADIRMKLEKTDVPQDVITQILNKLESEGFIDEHRYAGAYVRDKFRLQGWGPVKIANMLSQEDTRSRYFPCTAGDRGKQCAGNIERQSDKKSCVRERKRSGKTPGQIDTVCTVKGVHLCADISGIETIAIKVQFFNNILSEWISFYLCTGLENCHLIINLK